MSCPVFDQCRNNAQCHRCFDQHLYKPHKQPKTLQAKSLSRTPKKKGLKAEQDFIKTYQKSVGQTDRKIQQQIASGALYHQPGDVQTFEEMTSALYEIKEKLVEHTKGKKSFTIQKEWLTKIKKESRQLNKDFYALPFRFMDDDSFYVIIELEILLDLVERLHILSNTIKN